MMKHKEQRVAVLIDVQNMYYSARNLFGARVNFGKVLEDALGKRMLVRAIAYVVRTKTGEEKPFFEALIKIGIETKEKDLQEFFGGAKKADWDVGITIDAVKLAKKVDVVVLVSGDGDFCPLVEYLKNSGCFVEVVAFEETTSSKLIDVSDDFLNLSENQEKYLIKSKNSEKSMIIRKGKKVLI